VVWQDDAAFPTVQTAQASRDQVTPRP
jgi:hypothetical protein